MRKQSRYILEKKKKKIQTWETVSVGISMTGNKIFFADNTKALQQRAKQYILKQVGISITGNKKNLADNTKALQQGAKQYTLKQANMQTQSCASEDLTNFFVQEKVPN